MKKNKFWSLFLLVSLTIGVDFGCQKEKQNSYVPPTPLPYSKATVQEFMKIYQSGYRPTISEFSRFYGDESVIEIEFKMEEAACRINQWTKEQCADFFSFKKIPPEQRPSLYLIWLKMRFPLNGEGVKETVSEKIEISNSKPVLPYEVVEAETADGKIIKLTRGMNYDSETVYGRMRLLEVGGDKVDDVFEKELKRPSVLMLKILKNVNREGGTM